MRLLVGPLILLTFAMAGCATRPTPPGTMVPIGDHRVHLYCSGPLSSTKTVIVEGANMGLSPFYRNLQLRLERDLRVCTYDRSGIAWSEAAAGPRDARSIAAELRALLQQAGLRPPYILAGHSIGALFVLRYTHDYPEEVAGLALLDPSHPDQYGLQADPAAGESRELKELSRLRWMLRLGLSHIYNPYRSQLAPLPPDAFQQGLYFTHQTTMIDAISRETESRRATFSQAKEVTTIGRVPLLVISRGILYSSSPKMTAEQNAQRRNYSEKWMQLHSKYLELSANSRRVVVDGSTHYTLISERAYADRAGDEIVRLSKEEM
jgi:pimeloyl-ACP methyl ester carboxylesterase